MFEQPLKFFVVFFVVVEPVSLIPLFTGLTVGAASAYKRRMAIKAVTVAAAILLLFALGGAAFLKLMGISLEAFRIFGGLLLFLLALEMVFARESGTRTSSGEAAERHSRKARAMNRAFPPDESLAGAFAAEVMIGKGDFQRRFDRLRTGICKKHMVQIARC